MTGALVRKAFTVDRGSHAAASPGVNRCLSC